MREPQRHSASPPEAKTDISQQALEHADNTAFSNQDPHKAEDGAAGTIDEHLEKKVKYV